MPHQQLNLSERSIGEYLLHTELLSLRCSEQHIDYCKLSVASDKIKIRTLLKLWGRLLVEPEADADICIGSDHEFVFARVDYKSSTANIQIWTMRDSLEKFKNQIHDVFVRPISVKWVYDKQYYDTIDVALPAENLPFDEMYPFLNGTSLHDYYDEYINGKASILVLIGPPGTAKTSWIRGLLHHTKQNAILTYHQKLLDDDEFFAEWIKSETENILVIEDADNILAAREDGNDMMQRFLNMGDGLISIQKKKIIFTTNLPNVSSIDPALIRKGRCHDVLTFDLLTVEQASKVAEKAGVNFVPTADRVSIADIFSDHSPLPIPQRSVGFY